MLICILNLLILYAVILNIFILITPSMRAPLTCRRLVRGICVAILTSPLGWALTYMVRDLLRFILIEIVRPYPQIPSNTLLLPIAGRDLTLTLWRGTLLIALLVFAINLFIDDKKPPTDDPGQSAGSDRDYEI